MRKKQRPHTYVCSSVVENGHLVGVGLVWVLHRHYVQSSKIMNFQYFHVSLGCLTKNGIESCQQFNDNVIASLAMLILILIYSPNNHIMTFRWRNYNVYNIYKAKPFYMKEGKPCIQSGQLLVTRNGARRPQEGEVN